VVLRGQMAAGIPVADDDHSMRELIG